MLKTAERSYLFSISSAELPEGRKRLLFRIWNIALLLLSSLGLCLVSLFLAYGAYPDGVFLGYLRHPFIILLNAIPIALFQLLLFAVFNRQYLAFGFTGLLFIGASIGNYYKLKFRCDPFMFSDIGSVTAALGAASEYDLTPDLRILFCVLCVLGGTVFLFFFVRGRLSGKLRALCAALVLLSVLPLWEYVYSSDDVYENKAVANDYINPFIGTQLYISKGFVYPFLHSITVSSELPPAGYDEGTAAELLAPYADADIPEGRKVNVLVFQLEAFNDLTRIGLENVSDQVYSAYHRLEEESYTGDLIVNVFGGGTINSERAFLTGNYKPVSPRAPTPSYVWYLRQQGYTAIGNHPYYRDYYNRLNANTYLGFESYRFYEDTYSSFENALVGLWFDDGIFLSEVLSQFRQQVAAGSPVFSFNVTLQGHGPYDTENLLFDQVYWDGEGFSSYAYNALNNYLGSVADTGELLWNMTRELRDEEYPVVLVLYGDHNPWMGDNNCISTELGLDFDLSTESGFTNFYSTRYLIWANDAAKEQLGRDFVGEGPAISVNYLMNLLFEQLGWTGNAYMQFSDAIRETLPVISSNGGYVENGSFTFAPSDSAGALIRDMEYVLYYQRQNFAPAVNEK